MGAWNSSAVASSPSGAPENPPATKAEFVISAAVEDLGEGLGHCVAGDLRVAGEGVDRAPEPFGVGPIHGLDALVRLKYGRLRCPSLTKGAFLVER